MSALIRKNKTLIDLVYVYLKKKKKKGFTIPIVYGQL